ncbi:hypothetical protein BR93DRAFT_691041 [Coniochaeta sp. PMI_546]|nr:hypothetical protein BR93DRAFT_691041 [Coniochaeta sp. PMI_546]
MLKRLVKGMDHSFRVFDSALVAWIVFVPALSWPSKEHFTSQLGETRGHQIRSLSSRQIAWLV